MAANIDDIKLKLAVETAGAEGITTLAKDLSALAKEGGDAAPEFQRLSQEFQKIAEQAQLVQAFGAASAKLDDLTAKAASAATQVDKLRIELEQNQAVARQAETAYRTTGDRIDELKGNLRLYATAQASVRVENQTGALTAEQYAKKMGELRKQIEETTTEIVSLEKQERTELQVKRDAVKAAAESEAAYKKAATSSERLSSAVAKANSSYETAKVEMNAVGIEAADLATAQQRVASSMERSRVETERSVAAYENAKQEVAEFNRLYELQIQTRKRLEAAARDEAQVIVESSNRAIAAANAAAEARKKAAAEERAEFERLYQLEQSTRLKMQAAAQQQLAAEKQAFAEAAAAEEALIQRRTQAYMAMSAKVKKSLADAFSTAGVRSEATIRSEIANINEALIKLATTSGVTGKDFDRAFASAQIRLKELNAELTKIPGKLTMADQAAGLLKSQLGMLAAAFGAFEIGRGFIDANVQMESLRRALALITGSTESAARQISFLQDVANRTGQKVGDLSEAFIKLQASAKASNIPLEVTNGVFKATANAAGQLGLSSNRTGLILEALGQIANKGTVSMEELRQQIGDSLPGALSIASKGLGITEQELTKLVETGNLMARDFFPAFEKGLTETFGSGEQKIEGFRQSWGRLTNAVQATYQFIGDSGVMKGLAVVLENAGVALRGLTGAFELLGKIVGITFGAIATFDFAAPIASIQRWRAAVQEAAVEIQKSLDKTNANLTAQNKGLVDSQGQVVAAIDKTGAASANAQGAVAGLATAQGAAATAATSNATAQKGVADAANASASAARDATGVWVQLQVAYAKVNEMVEKASVVANKMAEAKKLEMDATLALAQMVGNEAATKQQAAILSEAAAAASREYAAAKKAEVDVLKAQLAAARAVYESEGQIDKAREEALKKIEDTIKAKEADAEVSKQKAAAAGQEALSNKVLAETYKDNAARLGDLKKAHEASIVTLRKVFIEQALGKATQEQLTKATQDAAAAEALLNDALKDAAEAADRKISALQRVATQTQASLAVEQARIRTSALYTDTLIEQAKADEAAAIRAGDVTRAVEAGLAVKDLEIRKVRDSIDAKEVEIKVIRAKIEAANAEAKAVLAAAEAEKAQLIATNSLTEAKKAEIEARIASAKLKQTEAELLAENIKQINEEIDALRAKRRASAEEAYAASEAKDAEIAKRRENISTIDAETSAIQRKNLMDADGFATDASGKRIEAMGYTPTSVAATLQGFGFDEARARQVASTLFDGNGNLQTGAYSNLIDPRMGEGVDVLLRKIAERELFGSKVARTGNETQAAPAASSTPVVVNIAGFKRTVNVASQADATTLVQVLESAFGRSA